MRALLDWRGELMPPQMMGKPFREVLGAAK